MQIKYYIEILERVGIEDEWGGEVRGKEQGEGKILFIDEDKYFIDIFFCVLISYECFC